MSKWIALPVLAAAGMCVAQTPPPKVGILNIQSAIASTQDGKKAAADLEVKYTPLRKKVESEQNAINALKDQLQKGQNTMSEAAKADLVSNIDTQTKKLNREMEDDEANLQQDQQKVLQTIGQKMMVVIDKYAKDHGYTLIIDVSSPQTPVLYAASSVDVTKDIMELYDRNTMSGSSPSPARPSSSSAAPKPAQQAPAAKPNH